MSKEKQIAVAVIDDEESTAEAIQYRLSNDKRTQVAGVFSSAEEAAIALENLKPDVLLVDLGLPGISGIELISKIRWKNEGMKIMVLTASNDHDTAFKALKAGADGYLVKEGNIEGIADSVVELHNGGAPISPGIARAIVLELHGRKPAEDNPLTKAELEILGCLCDGMTYKEIAFNRNISWHTVNSHVRSIYDKLHASGRHDAVSRAREAGIIK